MVLVERVEPVVLVEFVLLEEEVVVAEVFDERVETEPLLLLLLFSFSLATAERN